MKKNVWILNHYAGDTFFDKGGRHYWFASFLKENGYFPTVFCANSDHATGNLFFQENALMQERVAELIDVPYVFVSARSYRGNGVQRVRNMFDFFFNIKRVAIDYASKHGKPDIIVASSVHPLTLVAGIQLAKRFQVKCICEVRDLWPESIVVYSTRWKKTNSLIQMLYRAEKWIYKKADAVVFTMEGAYDYIKEQKWESDVPRSKVYCINNGVDLAAFNRNKEQFTLEDEDLHNPNLFKVVYTGSIRKVNNLGLLLDAAKEVHSPNVRFLIWGDGDELESLKQRAVQENISNVCFKGRVQKEYVPYIVSKADLNIAHNNPSPLFRFGISFNKLFDYFAAGKPVLSDFPCPYNPAVQLHAGIGVDTPDAASIARAVEHFVHLAPEDYQEYCRNASKTAEKYDFRALTQQLMDVIEAI